MLFIAAMLVVFGLGMLASSILNRRAEIASVFNNKKTEIDMQKTCNKRARM